MQPKYRNIIENFELTKAQGRTLFEAHELLADMKDWMINSNCSYDEDLLEAIEAGIKGLTAANARLNVNALVEED